MDRDITTDNETDKERRRQRHEERKTATETKTKIQKDKDSKRNREGIITRLNNNASNQEETRQRKCKLKAFKAY